MLTFLFLPSTIIVVRWILGSHRRGVCCLEWLTLRPNLTCFPQISHFIETSLSIQICVMITQLGRPAKGQDEN